MPAQTSTLYVSLNQFTVTRALFWLAILFALALLAISEARASKAWNSFTQDSSYYGTEEANQIAQRIVVFQRPTGGWGKRIDPSISISSAEQIKLEAIELMSSQLYDSKNQNTYSHKASTFDEKSTSSHLRYLARIQKAQPEKIFADALRDGTNYILNAQLPSGGWPQNYPNTSSYGGLVTFNDNAMTGVMTFLQEVVTGDQNYLSDKQKQKCKTAYEKGLKYLINAQIKIKGKLTGWAQQYESNYTPARGRTYELPAIAAYETTNILKFLMHIETPSKEVQKAILSGIAWLNSVKLENTSVQRVEHRFANEPQTIDIREDPASNETKQLRYKSKGYDKVILGKENHNLWARFYSLDTIRPLYSDWRGVPIDSFTEIQYERRVGYMWHGTWPKSLIETHFPKWLKKHGLKESKQL